MFPPSTSWVEKAEAEKHSPVIRCYIAVSEKVAKMLQISPQELNRTLITEQLSRYIAFTDLALEEGMRKQPQDSDALQDIKSIFSSHQHDAHNRLTRELRHQIGERHLSGVSQHKIMEAIDKVMKDTFAAIYPEGMRKL